MAAESVIASPDTSMRGLLVSFDGVDSSGKATQTKLLVDRLRFNGFVVHQFSSPDYDTPSGRQLKLRLQNKLGDWVATPWREKLGYFATNRLEHREEVLSALEQGEIVIYDRYVPSSQTFIAVEALAEDSALHRTALYEEVAQEEYEKNKVAREDCSIFLDVPPRVSAVLLEERKEKLQDSDEYTDHISVQERLYEEYNYLCATDTRHFFRVPCVIEVELLDTVTISELVWAGLRERFPQLAKT